MTWTYTADPTSSAKDAVRFLVGDTTPNAPFTMQDEEIAWNLAEVNGEVYRASANSAENLAALYTGQAKSESKTVGGLEITRAYNDRAKEFQALANMLLLRGRRVNPPLVNADENALHPELRVGIMDPYFAEALDWPNNSVTGVTSEYGTDDDFEDGWTP